MSDKNKRVIGITGGIGSGKTKVLELIKNNYDALVIEADKVGHEIQMPGEEAYYNIIEAFGSDILKDGQIDRKKLGSIVFADKDKLQLLNNITHPAIHKRICDIIKNSDNSLIFLEAAILTESSLASLTDAIWYIYADTSVRLERLETFRLLHKEKAVKIMCNQPDDYYFRKRCKIIIDNSYTEENTLKQIDNEIKKIQEESYE